MVFTETTLFVTLWQFLSKEINCANIDFFISSNWIKFIFKFSNLIISMSCVRYPFDLAIFFLWGPRSFFGSFSAYFLLKQKKFNSKVNLIFYRKLRLIFALNLTKSFIFVKIFTSLVVLKGVFSPNLGEKVTLTRASISFRLKSS